MRIWQDRAACLGFLKSRVPPLFFRCVVSVVEKKQPLSENGGHPPSPSPSEKYREGFEFYRGNRSMFSYDSLETRTFFYDTLSLPIELWKSGKSKKPEIH